MPPTTVRRNGMLLILHRPAWQGAVSLAADNSQKTDYRRVAYTAERVTKIITPTYYVVEGDTVCYEFNTGFHGYVRVTLRDANMKERSQHQWIRLSMQRRNGRTSLSEIHPTNVQKRLDYRRPTF